MPDQSVPAPDNTAVRVAWWRALYVEADAPPHVFEDRHGVRLAREAGHESVHATVPRRHRRPRLGERYFAGRSDGLRPPRNAEELLIATT